MSTAQKPTDLAPSPVGSLKDLSVKLDGNPAGMERAFVKRIGGGEYQVHVTNRGGSCRELIDNLFTTESGATTILANVGRRLSPNGTFQGEVTDVFIHGFGSVDPGSSASIAGDADAGSQVKVSLDYSAHADATKLVVKGSFDAEGCGERVETGMGFPKAAHASSATLTIAGQKLSIKGARVRKERILLSSNVVDCSPLTPRAEAVLAHEYGKWELSGAWFRSSSVAYDKSIQGETMAEVKVTPGKTGTSADGATVELTLSGSGKVGDYALGLSGAIEALSCND